jgi:CDP-glycerol glycerophosphotransferase
VSVPPSPGDALRRVRRAGLSEVHAYWRRRPVEPATVLYESFAGNGMLCNPEAIFRELLAAPDLQHLRHVWVLSDPRRYQSTVAEFAGRSNVEFVRRGTSAYFRALATSRYLINNATFPPQFSKRRGQVYLNTWHGTPLKRMGFDMPAGASESANTLRNFAAADYLLSANPFMTETMYGSAYKLDGIYPGGVIEAGYPRIDHQFSEAGRDAVLDRLAVDGDRRRIVLFAPTWRGASFQRPEDDLDETLQARDAFAAGLDPAQWRVLLKVHQSVYGAALGRPGLAGQLVPNDIPTNAVLAVTDVLVTDYSSIFFDFLTTRRPIVFYTPDQSEYGEGRGLYRDPSTLPGPVLSRLAPAVEAVRRAADGERGPDELARYDAARREFSPWEDGHAAERVVDVVFRGKQADRLVRRFPAPARKKVLLHLGAMRPNGITSSALNLVNSLDHERLDVTVTYPEGLASRRLLEERDVHPGVRHLPRVGGMNGSKLPHLRRRVADRFGRRSVDLTDPTERALWDDEWTRCFGAFRFDDVIDFSGYGPVWARMLLHSPDAVRSIWLHNDMASDAQRSVHGKRVHQRSLRAVFSHYDDYDHLVSVSPSLAAINRAALAEYAPAQKFTAARNCIDHESIRRLAALDPEWAEDEIPLEGFEGPRRTTGETVFVTAGRLSPEKNHVRLIRAFAAVHAARPETRLLIIGGGPLLPTLEDLVAELGLGGSVHLVGQRANPYALMARSDCFVLSSDYEGQPMVLLEAGVLGMPVVTVEFASVADALPGEEALVVAQSDEAVAAGMMAFLDGGVPPVSFDAGAYNRLAVEEFLALLD